MIKPNNIRANMKEKYSTGFTIPELLVATSVFSVVLVSTMAIFFILGNLFFKGITITQTQQTAKKIQDSLTADIYNAGSFVGSRNDSSYNSNTFWYCVGNNTVRYTKQLYYEVDLSSSATENPANGLFGLIRDTIPEGQLCVDPYSSGSFHFYNPEELLGNKNRINVFEITQLSAGSDIYNTSITVATGDNDVLNGYNTSLPSCINGLSLTQFCAVTTLNTTISQQL